MKELEMPSFPLDALLGACCFIACFSINAPMLCIEKKIAG
jgi:hypothetical protein